MEHENEVLERNEAVAKVLNVGLDLVRERYGVGNHDGETPLAYHNLAHTLKMVSVVESMSNMAIAEGKLTTRDRDLLKIAASFHDVEQNMGKQNETVSAETAERVLVESGSFSPEDINTVKRLILVTQCTVNENGLTQNTNGSDLMEAIIADADMNNAGEERTTFLDVSMRLAREIAKKDDLDSKDLESFWKFQVKFLKGRKYFTDYAKSMFPNVLENTKYAENVVSGYPTKNPS